MKTVAWGISGAGHFLREILPLVASLEEVDLFYSRAASEVTRMYRCRDFLDGVARKSTDESDYSSFASCRFAAGAYDLCIIAPATSNTVAKCSLGIADTLLSNLFAQGGKFGVPLVVLPTDVEEEVLSLSISGKPLSLRSRPVDLEHVKKLETFSGVRVVRSPEELALLLRREGCCKREED